MQVAGERTTAKVPEVPVSTISFVSQEGQKEKNALKDTIATT